MSEPAGDAPERTALKEWAVLCDALAGGEIVAMVRKGGIREQRAGFAVRHHRFLLYPTYFHEKAAELQPRFASRVSASMEHRPPEGVIRISHVAEVVAVWHVRELERLREIEREHGLAWPAVVSRFEYRGKPEVRVVAVRVLALPGTRDVAETRRYQGCVSWVELDAGLDVSGARAVMGEGALARRVEALAGALGAPE
ncbi:MAG: DUF1802 family protein [Gemmatimonadaceae bacterium]|nr:DUF1802 family protein [Gemmatimonadaceae bacterium]NUQ91761.1 DUF1802 family protein [Gemmatimonadaceae bacterium]NUR20255.1 DUF1802 family protein [Gemmatimonadaceae bacterium]NUS98212.1 DUF1802 family protein [Gemmatimonadaceae bacterium]